jgi:hypothetical protein
MSLDRILALKETVNDITDKEALIQEIDKTRKKYLRLYNDQSEKSLPEIIKNAIPKVISNAKIYYGLLRDRAIQLNVDISKYPEELGELTN